MTYSGSLTTLRKVVSQVKHVKGYLAESFVASISDISERSNTYTGIARLPGEIFIEILLQHVDGLQKSKVSAEQFEIYRPLEPPNASWKILREVSVSAHIQF